MTNRSLRETGPRFTGVIAAKGGIGQSTVCLDWARALGRGGRRCLLVELAGGDIAWLVGAEPHHFTEDVAGEFSTLSEAIVSIENNVDLLATGNRWSIYGPPSVDSISTLFELLGSGEWDEIVIDIGDVSRSVAELVIQRMHRRVVLLHDDITCVARTYTLLRMLGATVLANDTALVFNRSDDSTDADSLLNRFSQLTTRFLNRTWPLMGTIPSAESDARVAAIGVWGMADMPMPEGVLQASTQMGIINRPVMADN